MVSDPIADFIIQLKNAALAGKRSVMVPYSRLRYEVARKLQEVGYVSAVEKHGKKEKKKLEVHIMQDAGRKPRITDVERISKPSRRVYVGIADIRPVRHGAGTLLLSTSRGVLTGEEARKERVGGEALFSIW